MRGQIVLILLLVITVALGIGLAVVSRSITDVSTATKVEDSSRAFSAAEAGIEKAIQGDTAITSPILIGQGATLNEVQKNTVPAVGQALEYPPLNQEDVAQIWLADPATPNLDKFYDKAAIDVYWGSIGITNDNDKPAVELTVVYKDTSGNYLGKKFFYDPNNLRATNQNRFSTPSCPNNLSITTSMGPDRKFLCKANIDLSSSSLQGLSSLMLIRSRLLYNQTPQPFALNPLDGGSLPHQAKIYTSIGSSGQTQRKVSVFKLDKVVPPYFDYAIFSAADITK